MARATKTTAGDEVVSGPVLAKRLGLTATSVSRLAVNGVLVRKSRGKYLAWASARAYISHVSKTNRASPASVARAKLLDIQAKRAEFAMAREMAVFVRAADVCADVTEVFRIARDHMMQIPRRIAQDSPHLLRSDITRLEDSVRAGLTELGARGEAIAKEIEDAKQHGERHNAGVPTATQARRRLRR
jgi:phage terminase Nu1 subunit (DNA packaging protein)